MYDQIFGWGPGTIHNLAVINKIRSEIKHNVAYLVGVDMFIYHLVHTPPCSFGLYLVFCFRLGFSILFKAFSLCDPLGGSCALYRVHIIVKNIIVNMRDLVSCFHYMSWKGFIALFFTLLIKQFFIFPWLFVLVWDSDFMLLYWIFQSVNSSWIWLCLN